MSQRKFLTVRSDTAKCAGHARCASVAPEIFELDDNGYNTIALRRIPEDLASAAQRAARACPERIIQVESFATDDSEV
jgi:ferredoxin